MESPSQLISGDSLNLNEEPCIVSLLTKSQKILFSTSIKKVNEDKLCQDRIFLLTSETIYNLSKNPGIIKSLFSKLITMQNRFSLKRKINLKNIYGITISKFKDSRQFVLHVKDEYDYRYCTQSYQAKVILLKVLCRAYENFTGKKLAFYFKDDMVLQDYTTSKADLKNKINRKPKEDPVFLGYKDFQEYELPDINYQLQYFNPKQTKFKNVSMRDFRPIFQVEQLESGVQYFTLESSKIGISKLRYLLNFNFRYFLHPEFVFSTKNKTHMIVPFMIGGNLARKINMSVKISQELVYFYIAQLIIILQELQQKGIAYDNFCLENMYINENGYLRIKGIDDHISQTNPQNQKCFDIVGYPQYIAPQMILTRGYHKQKANIWKLGICMFKIIFGRYPFTGNNVKQIYGSILGGRIESKFQEKLPDLILQTLKRNPQERATLQDLKKNIAFNKIKWEQVRQEQMLSPYLPDSSSWKGNLPSIVMLKK